MVSALHDSIRAVVEKAVEALYIREAANTKAARDCPDLRDLMLGLADITDQEVKNMASRIVRCTTCPAEPQQDCTDEDGNVLPYFHECRHQRSIRAGIFPKLVISYKSDG